MEGLKVLDDISTEYIRLVARMYYTHDDTKFSNDDGFLTNDYGPEDNFIFCCLDAEETEFILDMSGCLDSELLT